MAGFFYSVGPDAERTLKDYFDDYYEYGDAAIQSMISQVTTYSIPAIRKKLSQFESVGCDLVILDGTSFAGPPVATVQLPARIPFGFHGSWIPSVV